MTTPAAPDRLHFTGDAEADRLLATDPLALLIGFVLDQQVPVQKAFSGPLELRRRLGTLDAAEIAALPVQRLVEVFQERPALHRFPANMARRTHELCAAIAGSYEGDASRVWTDVGDAAEIKQRLLELPGIGPMKADTLFAILAKRFAVQPSGWQAVLPTHPTLADVDSPAALADYQAGKRARKAELKRASSRSPS